MIAFARQEGVMAFWARSPNTQDGDVVMHWITSDGNQLVFRQGESRCILIASGSWTLRADPPRLVVAGAVAALVLPLLLLVRQWLGWTYVMKRLLAEKVDYEESGWYDGQTWEKPLSWRSKDLLVARHEVRPILGRLSRAMAAAAGLMLGGASLCQAL
mgnify:CR=1 FL=1